jgi:hypothetical protein
MELILRMHFQLRRLLLLTPLLGLAEAGRSKRTADPELIIRDGMCRTEIPCDGNDYIYSAAAAPSPAEPVAEDTVQLEARMTNAERLARGYVFYLLCLTSTPSSGLAPLV